MKIKIFLSALTIAFVFTIFYQHNEINRLRNKNFNEFLKIFNEYEYEYKYKYTKYETQPVIYLEEVPGFESEDILKRIDMLKDHADYCPSPKWIGEVVLEARKEIAKLRDMRTRIVLFNFE